MADPPPASFLTCSISGAPISTIPGFIAVTPSGRICSQSLLLAKLAENGGLDPFTSQPLDESKIIILQNPAQSIQPPRIPSHSSFESLLKTMQQEHDALVLELFDTRQALQETRKELSQSLYQNDAAVRVIARLSMERDMARQQLMNFESGKKRPVEEEKEGGEKVDDEISKKKAKVEPQESTGIPPEDVEIMLAEWKKLSKGRKKRPQPKTYITQKEMGEFKEKNKFSLHKTSAKPGLTALKANQNYVCSAGFDKNVIVFDVSKGTILTTLIGATKEVQCMDISHLPSDTNPSIGILTASADRTLRYYQNFDEETTPPQHSLKMEEDVLDVSIHPTQRYFVVSTSTFVSFGSLEEMKILATFHPSEGESLTCGAMHPDGLIYASGTASGNLLLWDLRAQSLATSLSTGERKVQSIEFSENGYHVAITSPIEIQLWDLRKQKCLYHLDQDFNGNGISFDASGKFLAYTSKDQVKIVLGKDGALISSFDCDGGFLCWGTTQDGKWMVTANRDQRSMKIWSCGEEEQQTMEE